VLGEDATDAVVDLVLADAGVPAGHERGTGVEVIRRGARVFTLNHLTGEATVEAEPADS
jgi:hypothetical protein